MALSSPARQLNKLTRSSTDSTCIYIHTKTVLQSRTSTTQRRACVRVPFVSQSRHPRVQKVERYEGDYGGYFGLSVLLRAYLQTLLQVPLAAYCTPKDTWIGQRFYLYYQHPHHTPTPNHTTQHNSLRHFHRKFTVQFLCCVMHRTGTFSTTCCSSSTVPSLF